MHAHDAQVQLAVLHELARDSRIDETDVGVEVSEGIVTLTGQVNSWSKRLAAQEAAHRVPDVLDVVNDVHVRIPGVGAPTDTEIAFEVRRSLRQVVGLEDRSIRTTVSAGTVTLGGRLSSWEQRDRAEVAIASLKGIRGVVNQIEVAPSANVAPAELLDAVEQALGRQALREARRLVLKIEHGEVTVAGTVHSASEQRAVLGALRGIPGVGRIANHLRVDPFAP